MKPHVLQPEWRRSSSSIIHGFHSLSAQAASMITDRPHWPVLAAAAILFAYFSTTQLVIPTDDAFISFVYSKNLVEHGQFVYNINQDPVEGYTNFLWAALAAIPVVLDLDVPRAMQLMAIIFGVGAIIVQVQIVLEALQPENKTRRLLAASSAFVLALNGTLVYWSINSMETSLVMFVLGLAVLCTLSAISAKSPMKSISAGLLAAVLCLSRFDMLLLVFAVVGLLLARRVLLPQPDRFGLDGSLAALWTLGFCLIYLPYSLWRINYYGYLLPNTYYAKVHGVTAGQIRRGLSYVRGGLEEGFYALPIVILVLSLAIVYWWQHRKEVGSWIYVGGGLSWLIVVIVEGGDFLGFHRFTLPAIFLLIPPVIAMADHICAQLGKTTGVTNPVFRAGAALGIALFSVVNAHHIGISSLNAANVVDTQRYRMIVGKILNTATHEDVRIAVIPAGIIKYYSERPVIDMLGLNDEQIAHREMGSLPGRPGHEKYDSGYVLCEEPEFIYLPIPGHVTSMDQLPGWVAGETTQWLSHWALVDLISQPELYRDYQLGFLSTPFGDVAVLYRSDLTIDGALSPAGVNWFTSN